MVPLIPPPTRSLLRARSRTKRLVTPPLLEAHATPSTRTHHRRSLGDSAPAHGRLVAAHRAILRDHPTPREHHTALRTRTWRDRRLRMLATLIRQRQTAHPTRRRAIRSRCVVRNESHATLRVLTLDRLTTEQPRSKRTQRVTLLGLLVTQDEERVSRPPVAS